MLQQLNITKQTALTPAEERKVLSCVRWSSKQDDRNDCIREFKFNSFDSSFSFFFLRSDARLMVQDLRGAAAASATSLWLNDSAMNCACFLFRVREEAKARLCPLYSKKYIASTEFMYHVMLFIKRNDTSSLREYCEKIHWNNSTKEGIDMFTLNLILLPGNIGNTHWILFAVYPTQRTIIGFCSLHKTRANYAIFLLKWLEVESGIRGLAFDASQWKYFDFFGPLQINSWDCGPNVLKIIDRLTDDQNIDYDQNEILLFRSQILLALLNGRLSHPIEFLPKDMTMALRNSFDRNGHLHKKTFIKIVIDLSSSIDDL